MAALVAEFGVSINAARSGAYKFIFRRYQS